MSEEEGQNDMGFFLWENQSWGGHLLSNSDNSGESNPPKTGPFDVDDQQEETNNEGEALNKKRSQGNTIIASSRSRSDRKKIIISGEGKDGKGGESDPDEIHMWTERERRKKMRNMFASLHALLPQLPSKADKSTIVDEAVNYIKYLQGTLQKLKKQKLEGLQSVSGFGRESSLNVINPQRQWHHYDSREAFLADQVSSNNLAISNAMGASTSNPSNSLSVPRQPVAFQTWTSSNVVLNICGDEAQLCICSPKKASLFTTICFVLEKHKIEVICAQIFCNGNRSTYAIQAQAKRASNQFAEANSPEETFKQAAGEIMLWVS